jgi:hypothetical protein
MKSSWNANWHWYVAGALACLVITLGATRVYAYAWEIEDFEPLGFVSANGRQLALKLNEFKEGQPQANVRVAIEIEVFQPETGAEATGRWVAPYKARYSLWANVHALGNSPPFEEGLVIVRAQGVMWEGNRIVHTWEWWSEVYLFEDDE